MCCCNGWGSQEKFSLEKLAESAYKLSDSICYPTETVTLRDRFAMAALTGIIPARERSTPSRKQLASWAYEIADAMLAERAKPAEVRS